MRCFSLQGAETQTLLAVIQRVKQTAGRGSPWLQRDRKDLTELHRTQPGLARSLRVAQKDVTSMAGADRSSFLCSKHLDTSKACVGLEKSCSST